DQVTRDLKLYLTPERGANGAFAGFEVGDTYRPGRYRIVADRTGRSFSLLGAKGEELQQGAIGDSIGAALGFRWAPAAAALHAGSDLTFTVRPLRDAARKLANSLAVTLDPGGNFLRIGLTAEDATRGAATANAIAQRFVEVGADLKRAKLHQLGTLLDEQLRAARDNLRRTESALEQLTIPALAESLSAELLARERVLAPQIAAGEHELRGIPQRAIDEARLRRDLELATNLFTGVQQRYDEARLAEASSIADVRILDVAVPPQEPLKDTASRLLVLGFIAGLGLGLVGAVVADRVDPRMRYPDQVTRQMGLPILGVLPHVKDRAAGPDDEEVAQVIEAMRSVRLSLMHFYGGNGPVEVHQAQPHTAHRL